MRLYCNASRTASPVGFRAGGRRDPQKGHLGFAARIRIHMELQVVL